ncbi:MAG TPA: phosphoadenylyl-sulfate reductase [Acidimicrobiales bacterium]|nr:phosphoadenylyl-sulfate reductase [Acidimicrobiales bacterium]
MKTPTPTLLEELDALNARFETASPLDILNWTFERFGENVSMACSFEDVALLHMVHQLRPDTEIIFLDTGGHFAETLDFAARVEREWSLRLTRTVPGPDAATVPCGANGCCELRKVEPLRRALEGRRAWLTAVKRVDAATRATMRIVTWDDKFDLVKVNPLATWSDDDIAYYLAANELEVHPLWREGYASIGCAAVTVRPLVPGDRRSGRWAGADKEECGLHEA